MRKDDLADVDIPLGTKIGSLVAALFFAPSTEVWKEKTSRLAKRLRRAICGRHPTVQVRHGNCTDAVCRILGLENYHHFLACIFKANHVGIEHRRCLENLILRPDASVRRLHLYLNSCTFPIELPLEEAKLLLAETFGFESWNAFVADIEACRPEFDLVRNVDGEVLTAIQESFRVGGGRPRHVEA